MIRRFWSQAWVLAAGCSGSAPSAVVPVGFTLPDSVSLMDGSGAAVTAPELLRRVASSDLVLLGEVHDNPLHHTLRARLIDSFDDGRPAVVFEQFTESTGPIEPRRAGESVEQWLDRNHFDRNGWRWPLHQPVVEAALTHARSLWGQRGSPRFGARDRAGRRVGSPVSPAGAPGTGAAGQRRHPSTRSGAGGGALRPAPRLDGQRHARRPDREGRCHDRGAASCPGGWPRLADRRERACAAGYRGAPDPPRCSSGRHGTECGPAGAKRGRGTPQRRITAAVRSGPHHPQERAGRPVRGLSSPTAPILIRPETGPGAPRQV